jgi:hypothetical protein
LGLVVPPVSGGVIFLFVCLFVCVCILFLVFPFMIYLCI